MKTDVNGCSTCPVGKERYEEYEARPGVVRVQYEYRAPDGELFATVEKTLEEAREKRDEWLIRTFNHEQQK
jgi:hypothetical protein